jgi:8-oxo-dGTP pyrophosphatase MutT (NUDIX family)
MIAETRNADGKFQQNDVIAQSGVIPYRIRAGQMEIALVTASSGPHWTIPKGHIEPDLSPEDSAAKEAYEESGLLGSVHGRPLGSYVYEKRGRWRRVEVFALEVEKELKRWPEMLLRKRQWMTVEEAAARVKSAELSGCIRNFRRTVLRRERRAIAA